MARHDAETNPDGISVQRLTEECAVVKTGTGHQAVVPGQQALPERLRTRLYSDRARKITVPKG